MSGSSYNTSIIETPLLNCWLAEDGIVYSVSKNTERSIENYKILFEVYKKLSDNGKNKLCLIGDISKTQPLNKEVRDFIAAELPKYVKAMALISETPMGKTIGSFFKELQTSPYPIRMFDDLEEAQKWLLEFKPIENSKFKIQD